MLFTSLALVLAYALSEGICYLAQPLLGRLANLDLSPTSRIYERQRAAILEKMRSDRTNIVFDAETGWRYRANFRSTQQNSNSLGLRGTREYAPEPSPHVLRIAAFGDSFVYGNEVKDDETWAAQIESSTGIEVLNAGVGGYGTDQAYLLYRRFGPAYNAQIVLIGFTTVQLPRNVIVYRRFYAPADLMFVKPRFHLSSSGDLELLASPVRSSDDYWKYYRDPSAIRELGKHDFWYVPWVYDNPLYDYSPMVRVASQLVTRAHRKLSPRTNVVDHGQLNPNSEPFEITVKLLRRFANEVKKNKSLPVILLLPDASRLGADGRENPFLYEPLIAELRSAQLEYLDLATAFDRPVTRSSHFMEGGHYSPYANGRVAKAIAAYLTERELLPSTAALSPRSVVRSSQGGR